MTPSEYVQNAIRTESDIFPEHPSYPNLSKAKIRILHAALGCVTEAGELADIVKKNLFYGKQFDIVNAKEEVGDIFWYLALFCTVMNISFEEIWERNIAKLKQRYPEKFTKEKATNRDLQAERKILEGRSFGYTEDDNGRP